MVLKLSNEDAKTTKMCKSRPKALRPRMVKKWSKSQKKFFISFFSLRKALETFKIETLVPTSLLKQKVLNFDDFV